jgi:hypothetical protein
MRRRIWSAPFQHVNFFNKALWFLAMAAFLGAAQKLAFSKSLETTSWGVGRGESFGHQLFYRTCIVCTDPFTPTGFIPAINR